MILLTALWVSSFLVTIAASDNQTTPAVKAHSCEDNRWGPDCSKTCNCNKEGSTSCSPVSGCICVPGRNGRFCYGDVNECVESSVCRGANQVCFNTHGSYKCVNACGKGFKLSDSGCVDIDECATNNGGCEHLCYNIRGNFICKCYEGYEIDILKISACKKCAKGKWGVNCWNHCNCDDKHTIRCDNVRGCICRSGWAGYFCTRDTDECSTPNWCGLNAICTNTPGSYVCACKSGFKMENSKCVDVNECDDSSLCSSAHQRCVNKPGDYECVCQPGYEMMSGKCIRTTTTTARWTTIIRKWTTTHKTK